jgi:hypothetical protein
MRVAILPVGDYDWFDTMPDLAAEAIEEALEETAVAMKVDYRVTTRTWKTPVDFKIIRPSKSIREIYTDNKIYLFVSGGTKPHDIVPKNAPRLVFQTGYTPKSRVGKTGLGHIRSYKGAKFGPTVYAMKVKHPGTEPRDFPGRINKKWEKEWPKQLQRAIDTVWDG